MPRRAVARRESVPPAPTARARILGTALRRSAAPPLRATWRAVPGAAARAAAGGGARRDPRLRHVPPPGGRTADDRRDDRDGEQHEAALPPLERHGAARDGDVVE